MEEPGEAGYPVQREADVHPRRRIVVAGDHFFPSLINQQENK